MSQQETLIKLLKANWMSNFQIQQELKSSSADRVARKIRQNPPMGYKMIQRNKETSSEYARCLEYRLVEDK